MNVVFYGKDINRLVEEVKLRVGSRAKNGMNEGALTLKKHALSERNIPNTGPSLFTCSIRQNRIPLA